MRSTGVHAGTAGMLICAGIVGLAACVTGLAPVRDTSSGGSASDTGGSTADGLAPTSVGVGGSPTSGPTTGVGGCATVSSSSTTTSGGGSTTTPSGAPAVASSSGAASSAAASSSAATSAASTSTTGSSTSSSGTITGAPCQPTGPDLAANGNTGNFNTTGPWCVRTNATIHGWGVSNGDGRTVTVDGTAVTFGQFPLPAAWTDGYTYFDFTAGTYSYCSMYIF